MKKATCGHWRQYTAAMASFVMWLLLQSGDDWSWVIVGGFDSREDCRKAREAHVLAPELLLCAVTDPQAAVAPAAPPAPRGRDRSPWEAGVVPYGRTEDFARFGPSFRYLPRSQVMAALTGHGVRRALTWVRPSGSARVARERQRGCGMTITWTWGDSMGTTVCRGSALP